MKPQVRESEKSRVLSTKDYSMFEFPDIKISKRHLDFVKSSILDKNLLPDYPILVDEGYNILDGKYKFLACYELKIPIHYKVAEVTTCTDAIRIKEISKKTPLVELISSYKHIDSYSNIEYIKDFFNGFFRLNEIICCIDGMTRNKTGSYMLRCLNIDRYKVAAGQIPSYDVNNIIRRLTTIKYIMEEFKWPKMDAIVLMFSKRFEIDFISESKILRKCALLTQNSCIWSYYVLNDMTETEQDKYIEEEINDKQ